VLDTEGTKQITKIKIYIFCHRHNFNVTLTKINKSAYIRVYRVVRIYGIRTCSFKAIELKKRYFFKNFRFHFHMLSGRNCVKIKKFLMYNLNIRGII